MDSTDLLDFESGIEAYREKNFERAIEILLLALPDQWVAQLYLGMSYYMAGRHDDARRQFSHLKEKCPEAEIRKKAESAFVAVNKTINEAEATARRKKKEEEEEEVEW